MATSRAPGRPKTTIHRDDTVTYWDGSTWRRRVAASSVNLGPLDSRERARVLAARELHDILSHAPSSAGPSPPAGQDGDEIKRSGSALGAIAAWARGDMEALSRQQPLDSEQLALFVRTINDLTWRAERRPDLGHEGSQCGPDCWGCQRRIGGVHRSTP